MNKLLGVVVSALTSTVKEDHQRLLLAGFGGYGIKGTNWEHRAVRGRKLACSIAFDGRVKRGIRLCQSGWGGCPKQGDRSDDCK